LTTDSSALPEADTDSPSALDPAGWLERHGDYLFRYAMSRLRGAEAAEEVVQETFVSALKAKSRYSGRGAERAWLLGILKRKIIDTIRARRRESARGGEEDAFDPTAVLFDETGHWRQHPKSFELGPEANLERAEFWAAFRACLGSIPVRQAELFSLRELDGLSTEEICKELAITPSNLWTLLHRARVALARCLKPRMEGETARSADDGAPT
jgi:RNA polymerase sigma-70 factor (ECF subfamily)